MSKIDLQIHSCFSDDGELPPRCWLIRGRLWPKETTHCWLVSFDSVKRM